MIKSKIELVNSINSELADNSIGDISPVDIRHNLIDIIDSVHNLLEDKELNTLNFGTPDNTSVRFGEDSLAKLDLAGYSTSGNTAIGYAALQNNYQAIRNTALGSYSLNCNVHGYDNVGVGYSSLAGNTIGFGNVGFGSYALINNKLGDFNIAIGHGAGYYADKDTNNKLYIGSHNIDSTYICANPQGSGLVPLIYGDMQNNILGINTRSLHGRGVLETSGNITPSVSSLFSLGFPSYKWQNVFADSVSCSRISFDNNINRLIANSSGLLISGDILPYLNNNVNIGSTTNRFKNLFVTNINATSGIISTTTNYLDKTLYLASSGTGPFVGYLEENEIIDAGLVIRASGITDPSFLYQSTNNTCGETFRRWKSNIGIELSSGEYLMATSIIEPSSCFGLHLNSGNLFSANKNTFNNDINNIAGIGNINFIKDSGNADTEYVVSYIAQQSGIDIEQRFLYRAGGKIVENNKDKISGFVLKAFDEYGSDLHSGSNLDRFAISSFDNSSISTNSLVLMKNNETGGVLCINNFSDSDSTLAVPKTIFNVRSKTNATARITSETVGDTQTSLQLMGECNDLADGLELQFSRTNHFGDINIYQNSGLINFLRIEPSGSSHTDHRVGILSSGNINAMLTIGSSGNDSVSISMHSNPSNASSTAGYGKIYVNDKIKENQSHALKFIDGSGNIFDLVNNECDQTGSATFTKFSNTAIGIQSLSNRCNIDSSTIGNSAFGYSSLSGLDIGSYNSVFGCKSASNITTGSGNVVVGYNNLSNSSGYISDNIVIGNNIGFNLSSSNNLLVGNTYPIISGNLSTGDIFIPNGDLTVEKSNKILLKHSDGRDQLILRTNSLTIHDSDSEFPDQDYTFQFNGSGNITNYLLVLDHSVSGMTNVTNYENPIPARPFAELKGDLKLQGAVRFSNGYSSDGTDLALLSGVAFNNYEALTNIFIEGYAPYDIDVAESYNSASSGIVVNYNNANATYTLINRDKHNKIKANDYVIAIRIAGEYRPIWVSNENSVCNCCIR